MTWFDSRQTGNSIIFRLKLPHQASFNFHVLAVRKNCSQVFLGIRPNMVRIIDIIQPTTMNQITYPLCQIPEPALKHIHVQAYYRHRVCLYPVQCFVENTGTHNNCLQLQRMSSRFIITFLIRFLLFLLNHHYRRMVNHRLTRETWTSPHCKRACPSAISSKFIYLELCLCPDPLSNLSGFEESFKGSQYLLTKSRGKQESAAVLLPKYHQEYHNSCNNSCAKVHSVALGMLSSMMVPASSGSPLGLFEKA